MARFLPLLALLAGLHCARGDTMITVDSMPRVLFTGDSQTCGRNLAIDFPQLLEREFPIRVINTAVGGSNSSALLRPMTGGSVRIAQGDRVLHGVDVRWGMGPFPGQGIAIAGRRYTVDFIHEHPGTPDTEIHLVEPAAESYEGGDYAIDPGWEHRVARWRPAVVVLMYINDGTMPPPKRDDWREMIRRIRDMGAVPVLMSPVPIDDARQGGNHPGDNHRRVAQNAAAVRGLAEAEKCWFVDVYHLTFALDPALRAVIHDGIHPDTDGQTVILDGLRWVFREMGLAAARPSIKGWLEGDPTQPLRTAQPDHPDPDRQLTEGFSVAAFRRWDEYGLLAQPDGDALPFAGRLLFDIAAPAGAVPTHILLKAEGLRQASVRVGDRLVPLPLANEAAIPAEAAADGRFRLVLEGDGSLDWLAVRSSGPEAPRWRAPDHEYRQYRIEAACLRPGNLLANADCLADTGWILRDGAAYNRPCERPVGTVELLAENGGRLAVVADPGPARAYDLLRIEGSAHGNDGAFRIRQTLAPGRFLVRRRSIRAESGLPATLEHDDGCAIVPGGACLELPADASAEQTFAAPGGRVRVEIFHRVWDDQRLGTRDVPTAPARLVLSGPGFVRELAAPASFQWRQFVAELDIPAGPAVLRLLGRADGRQLFTGLAIHR